MVDKKGRGRPTKMVKLQEAAAVKAGLEAKLEAFEMARQEAVAARAGLEAKAMINQGHEDAVNLRYIAERLRDIKNMDEVKVFYKECVYNIGINTLRNGKTYG